MHSRAKRIRLLALLLGVVFLGAQFHFCADVSAAQTASHACPVCSVAGSAIAATSPSIAIIPVTNRLEVAAAVVAIFSAVPRAISPRAPPAL